LTSARDGGELSASRSGKSHGGFFAKLIHISLINELIPWNIFLLEKLTITRLVEKFHTFYGTRRFITVFTWVSHWSLSWVRRIQSKPSHTVSL